MIRVLLTGGCGFAGHHVVEHLLKNTDWEIVVLDKLTYASNGLDRLRDIEAFDNDRVSILTYDFSNEFSPGIVKEIGKVQYIVHMGAETHVDNSIADPMPFIQANVIGTYHVLEFAKQLGEVKQFVYFSTDEVYGPAEEDEAFKEWDRYNCTNPYAATKAAGEQLALSFSNTYGIPLLVTNTMNLFGERQHPEKFIPLVVKKILDGETVYIHSHPDKQQAGSRFYIHCRNMADALLFILKNYSIPRGKINITGEREVDNLTMAKTISEIIGKPLHYEMVDFHSTRPGHDLRYALDGSRLANIGWKPPVDFEKSLENTINWMLTHPKWLEL